MQKLKQMVVMRENHERDEGTMGSVSYTHLVYQKGYPDGIPCNLQTAKAWGMNEGDLFKCDPYLQIKTADGSHAMWVPSIGDILAEDWQIIQ